MPPKLRLLLWSKRQTRPTLPKTKTLSRFSRGRVRNRSFGLGVFPEKMAGITGLTVNRSLATRRKGRLAATIAAGTLVLASLPTASFALGALDDGVSLAAKGS